MRYAIISDIHANLEALTSCLEKVNEINPDKVICLGDLVDYCAQPNECMELLKKRCDVVLLGNHDEAQYNHSLANGFTSDACTSSIHTRKIIHKEFIAYLKTLPYTYSENNLFFVHASPFKPEEYHYCYTVDSAEENFKYFDEDVCFIGHSHIPVIYEMHRDKVRSAGPNSVQSGNRYIVNVGSVGQPRDGEKELSFGLFDTEKFAYKHIRADYDIESAAGKIIREGLPLKLAERLFIGV